MSTSVERTLRILELLAVSDKPLALNQVSDTLEIPRSTAYKILRALVDRGFVSVESGNAYAVGLKAFEVGAAHLRRTNVIDVVAPHLTSLTQRLGVTSHYAILDAGDVVYLYKEDPPAAAVQLASSLGVRLPASLTAVGKSCVAWLAPERLDAYLDEHVNGTGPVTRNVLVQELGVVRERGFSTDEGDTASGIRCVAAPVFDLNGPRGALGVSHMLSSQLDGDDVIAEVKKAAHAVSATLGGNGS